MKIVYCLNSVRGLGGIQKVTVTKANALAEIPGNEVYVVVTDHWMSHRLLLPLSDKVHFIDLKIHYYENDFKSKFHQVLSNFKIFKHYLKLQQVISRISPDVIVSVGQSEKYIVPLLRCRAVKIREVHFSSNYRCFTYSSKFKAAILNFLDYKIAAKGYHKVVLLTKEDKDTFFPCDERFTYINNPLTSPIHEHGQLDHRQKEVITVGRLTIEKDYASLIRVWKMVHEQAPDWKLYIIGEGSERKNLEQEIFQCKLCDSAFLSGYSDQVDALLNKASVFVLTSLTEGFALVLLEAMNAGLPVVSFACQFGPRDIIQDSVNGYLIENRNEKTMASKIIELINHDEKRKQMAQAAYQTVNAFSVPQIIKKWMSLFEAEYVKNTKT